MPSLPLFDALSSALPDTREAREEQLAKLPPAPQQTAPPQRYRKRGRLTAEPGERRIPRAAVDPCGHGEDCQVLDCPDCAVLRERGFQRCSRCPRWAHRSCQCEDFENPENLICSGCAIAESLPTDGRELRYEWVAPAALLHGTIDQISKWPEQVLATPTRTSPQRAPYRRNAP